MGAVRAWNVCEFLKIIFYVVMISIVAANCMINMNFVSVLLKLAIGAIT